MVQRGYVWRGRFHDWHDRLRRVADRSFLCRPNSHFHFSFDRQLWRSPRRQFWESEKAHLRGVVMSEICPFYEPSSSGEFLGRMAERAASSLHLPGRHACIDKISANTRGRPRRDRRRREEPQQLSRSQSNPSRRNRLHQKTYVNTAKGKKKIIAVDCGMKENIMRSLFKFPLKIKRVPFDYDYSEEEFDGIFISNGPGDPIVCKETVAILQKALKRKKPIFGICLGAQLLALSIGAKTYQTSPMATAGKTSPANILRQERCFLTSQNHGYAIDEKTLAQRMESDFPQPQ